MNVDHLLKQSCTVATAGVQDKFGKKIEGTPVTLACRFQKVHRTIATAQREVNSIDGLIWLSNSATVDVDDKIAFGGSNYRVMKVEPMVDGAGVTRHYEVMVQDWNTR